MGERPQGIINRQLVEPADLLIGVFWSRLGTPTSEAESGTAEEIGRFSDAGKPVLLYFSHESVPPDTLDTDQLDRLREFRNQVSDRALIVDFASREDLRQRATADLTRTIRSNFGDLLEDAASAVESPDSDVRTTDQPQAALVAQVQREREFSGVSSSGTPQYRTRHSLLIENRGTGDAEDLTFRFVAPDQERPPPTVVREDRPVARLPAGGSLEFPMAPTMGSAGQWEIVFNWQEDGTAFHSQQTLT
jgi:hypothetical protein